MSCTGLITIRLLFSGSLRPVHRRDLVRSGYELLQEDGVVVSDNMEEHVKTAFTSDPEKLKPDTTFVDVAGVTERVVRRDSPWSLMRSSSSSSSSITSDSENSLDWSTSPDWFPEARGVFDFV